MLANYSYAIKEEYEIGYSVFLFIHILFSSVFLLNYLVAILSTVYEDMMKKGNFAFKCNKYKYIERYSIAFQDQWGYSELIVHPPPLNLGLVTLLPSVVDKNVMQSTSKYFSMLNFWIENLVFLMLQLIYELSLVPFIYLRVFINVFKIANFSELLKLLPFWTVFGLIYLMYGVALDMYYYFKILCDY